jgi:multiple sugar transport system ATP-binding protein
MSNPGVLTAAPTRAKSPATDTPIETPRGPRPVRCAIRGVRKAFGTNPILKGVDVEIPEGSFAVLVGPSGCGKSTLLRLVAGLETADAGTIELAGRDVTSLPPRDRDVAMVFQSYALYPHLSVKDNLAFGLRLRKVAPAEIESRIREASTMLGLDALLDRLPKQLSGGQRQRVAMGRAIVRRANIFLFDEPLSNLDASLRGDIRLEIGQLVRRLGATALYVTHDHVEAMTLADRIAVMRMGRILQLATPREIYERPATSFVGGFLGSPRMNLLPARVDGDVLRAGPFRLPRPAADLPSRLEVGVRPEHVTLGNDGVPGQVVAVEPLGAESHLVVQVEGGLDLRAQARGFDSRRRGDAVRVAILPAHAMVFDADGEGARVA